MMALCRTADRDIVTMKKLWRLAESRQKLCAVFFETALFTINFNRAEEEAWHTFWSESSTVLENLHC